MLIALDRMERGIGALSAAQEVRLEFKIPVVSIARLDDLLAYLRGRADMARQLHSVERYRQEYGVNE